MFRKEIKRAIEFFDQSPASLCEMVHGEIRMARHVPSALVLTVDEFFLPKFIPIYPHIPTIN
jgi:hypothetical protein